MEIRTVPERATLCVRATFPVEKISDEMGRAYGEIAAYMGEKGIAFAGPPYALYRNMDMSALDVEMGFPVATPAEGKGHIGAGTLPAGEAAVGLHVGPYSDIEGTYERLAAETGEKGRETEDWCYEFYLNSPQETPPEELKTEIYFPLKAK